MACPRRRRPPLPPPRPFPPQRRQDVARALRGRVSGVDDLPRKRFGQGGVRPPRVSSRPQRSMRSSRGRCSSWSVAGGPWGEGRKTVGIMSLFFTAASRATASKNSDYHAMLNAIQHGVTIADLQICRKEQQCGLRNIGDWGDGGRLIMLVKNWLSSVLVVPVSGTKKRSMKIKVSRSKK